MNNTKEKNIKKFNEICKSIQNKNKTRKIEAKKILKKMNQIEENLDKYNDTKDLDKMLNNI